MLGFVQFLEDFRPEFLMSEATVFNRTESYAGTLDFIARIRSSGDQLENAGATRTLIGDIKTGKGVYPEVALQLAAYRHAEMAAIWRPRRMEKFRRRYYLLSEAEREMAVPVPEVDTGLVIHITPDHCDAYPVDCGPDIYRAFLFVLEAARWQFDLSKKVIGVPLVPVRDEVA